MHMAKRLVVLSVPEIESLWWCWQRHCKASGATNESSHLDPHAGGREHPGMVGGSWSPKAILHDISSNITPLNPSQTAPPIGDQVFRCEPMGVILVQSITGSYCVMQFSSPFRACSRIWENLWNISSRSTLPPPGTHTHKYWWYKSFVVYPLLPKLSMWIQVKNCWSLPFCRCFFSLCPWQTLSQAT